MAGEQNVITTGGQGTPRIVAGVHGTTASDIALDWAAREARLRGARLHLVLARDPADSCRAPYAPASAPAGDAGAAASLSRAAAHAARLVPRDRVTTELADGLPAHVLADRAAGASLLVLGAAPTGFIGPVARACLRQAPCPVVIVVPPSPGAAGPPLPRCEPESRRAAEPATSSR
jgi:nucleotide-binding universal stress UspA family protein